MLIEANAGRAATQQAGERSLANFNRFAPQVLAVELQQVEGVQEDVRACGLFAQSLEHRHAAIIAGDGLAVDQTGARPELVRGLDDQG